MAEKVNPVLIVEAKTKREVFDQLPALGSVWDDSGFLVCGYEASRLPRGFFWKPAADRWLVKVTISPRN
jgi:hypothetical protein